MALTLQQVEHVARLSRLNLTDAEKEMFREQLNAILEYAQILNNLPTEGVEPLAHVLPLANVMRQDVCEVSLSKEDVLANAPLESEGYFRVPKII